MVSVEPSLFLTPSTPCEVILDEQAAANELALCLLGLLPQVGADHEYIDGEAEGVIVLLSVVLTN